MAEAIGDETITVPREMMKGNVQEDCPQVVRIGNLLADGSLKPDKKEGSEWH